MNWIIAGGLGVAALVLLFSLIWLLKQRKKSSIRARRREDLRRSMQRLGLGVIWEAPFYNARLIGVAGQIQGISLRMELWDGDREGFLRLTTWYPRRLRQGLRLRTRGHRWFEQRRQKQTLLLDDKDFDEAFTVTSTKGHQDRASELFNDMLRSRLLQLAKEVDDIELGENCLYVYVGHSVEAGKAVELVEQTWQTAQMVYGQAAQIGPSKTLTKTEYEAASKQALGRGEAYVDEFPGGSRGESSPRAGASEG